MRFLVSDPLYLLLAVQMVIQVILIVFVVVLLVLERRHRINPAALGELREVVDRTRELSGVFQDSVQQRVDVLTRLIGDLDDKARDARRLIGALEETSVRLKNARSFGLEDVQKLSRGGYDPVEISQITGIPVGEIQLMIKVGDANA